MIQKNPKYFKEWGVTFLNSSVLGPFLIQIFVPYVSLSFSGVFPFPFAV